MKAWYLYILKCSDNTLYTGITNDLERRVKKHNDRKGSKYTRARAPVEIVYKERCGITRSKALKRELEVKKLNREQKLILIKKGKLYERKMDKR